MSYTTVDKIIFKLRLVSFLIGNQTSGKSLGPTDWLLLTNLVRTNPSKLEPYKLDYMITTDPGLSGIVYHNRFNSLKTRVVRLVLHQHKGYLFIGSDDQRGGKVYSAYPFESYFILEKYDHSSLGKKHQEKIYLNVDSNGILTIKIGRIPIP